MPLFLSAEIPAYFQLKQEGCNVRPSGETRKHSPIEILYINQMPALSQTATDIQWGRLLAATQYPIRITRAQPCDAIDWPRYDGLLLTGANLERKQPSEIWSWKSLQEILGQSNKLKGSFFTCWAAQIALEHDCGIERRLSKTKLFGLYGQYLTRPTVQLVSKKRNELSTWGHYENVIHPSKFAHALHYDLDRLKGEHATAEFHSDKIFPIPVARYGYVDRQDIQKQRELEILFDSPETHPGLICNRKGSRIYSFNHPEYDRKTLGDEYRRDCEKDATVSPPRHYDLQHTEDNSPPPWRGIGQIVVNHWMRKLAQARSSHAI